MKTGELDALRTSLGRLVNQEQPNHLPLPARVTIPIVRMRRAISTALTAYDRDARELFVSLAGPPDDKGAIALLPQNHEPYRVGMRTLMANELTVELPMIPLEWIQDLPLPEHDAYFIERIVTSDAPAQP